MTENWSVLFKKRVYRTSHDQQQFRCLRRFSMVHETWTKVVHSKFSSVLECLEVSLHTLSSVQVSLTLLSVRCDVYESHLLREVTLQN